MRRYEIIVLFCKVLSLEERLGILDGSNNININRKSNDQKNTFSNSKEEYKDSKAMIEAKKYVDDLENDIGRMNLDRDPEELKEWKEQNLVIIRSMFSDLTEEEVLIFHDWAVKQELVKPQGKKKSKHT